MAASHGFAAQVGGAEDYVNDFGVALSIAGLLAATFEGFIRRRLAEDVRELTRAAVEEVKAWSEEEALSRMMSPLVFQEVKDHIITRPFLRRQHQISIFMQWAGDSREYVVAKCKSRYDAVNLSNREAPYTIEVHTDEALAERFPSFTKISRVKYDAGLGHASGTFEGAALEERLEPWGNGRQLVESVSVGPRDRVHVEAEYDVIYPATYFDVWMIPGPQEGVNLLITHPVDLRVEAGALHPTPDKFRLVENEATLKSWAMEGVFLPYQCLELRWRPATETGQRAD